MWNLFISTFSFTILLAFAHAYPYPSEESLLKNPSDSSDLNNYTIQVIHPQKTPRNFNLEILSELPPVDQSMLVDDVKYSYSIRSGIPDQRKRWPGTINFMLDPAFTTNERSVVNSALQEIANTVCLRVVVLSSGGVPNVDHVYVTKSGQGCWSYVGRIGGRQNLNLQANGCMHKYIAVHEMIHAIGFHHEQVRPDRDNFVNIFYQNMDAADAGVRHNFDRQANSLTFNTPYDYYSIMHYGERDFSNNGQRTIQAKQNGVVVGSRGVVTQSDRQKLRRMYNCP